MKTKYLNFLISIFLVLLACSADQNPLSSESTKGIVSSSERILPRVTDIIPSDKGQLSDQDVVSAGTQGTIEIEFNEHMDSNTINLENIKIRKIDGPEITGSELTYYANRKLVIIQNNLFPPRSAYLINISPKIKDLNGNPLDGNNNGTDDGEYDEFVSQFYTSGGNSYLKDFTPPRISSWSPTGNGNLRSPSIRLNFTTSDLDTTTLNTLNIQLANSETGGRVDLTKVYVSDAQARFIPSDPLEYGKRYTVTVKALAIKDLEGNSLDTDEDGVSLPTEKDFTWEFIVTDGPNTDGTPPQVNRVNTLSDRAEITFNEEMDKNTFTLDNIRFFDNDGYIPGLIEPNISGSMVIYYFDRMKFGTVKYYISMEVTDKAGNKLDGDKDGIGGEPGEDDYSSLP